VDAAPDQMALVVYEGGAFGSSIADTSSYAASERQLGPVSRSLRPVRTSAPGAPVKSQEGAVKAKLGKLFPLLLKGKLSARSEYELALQHASEEVREEHLEQCRQYGIRLSYLEDEQPPRVPALAPVQRPALVQRPAMLDTQPNPKPRMTTPARALPNRFATPGLDGLLRQAHQHMAERDASKELAASATTNRPDTSAEPVASTLLLPAVEKTPSSSRAEHASVAEWAFAPNHADNIQGPAEPELTSTRLPAYHAETMKADDSRGDEDPYQEGDNYVHEARQGAQSTTGGELPTVSEPCLSPRRSQPSTPVLPAQSHHQLDPNNSSLFQFLTSSSAWHPLHPYSQLQPLETRSVYRTDDGYVHLSVPVLKAAGLWDESWDASDGAPFLQHVMRLDARH
jgi:hypothetical protein